MIQEPCASDGRLAWVSESAEQAVNTPNDEERLEQMSHPKNKVMERMTPPKGGMDLLGSARKAMERSCLISWSVSRSQRAPNTTRSTRQAFSVWVP